ncbi:MAG: helix-turn-helix domain-containing protein [Bacteroidetes bacterium]|nr:helix-turn-helix domain-containing protein [Bacteroidota bacterium]
MEKSSIEQNLFQLTSDFVQHTSQHIFLTGKAGTGKTTFLKHIREHCEKKMVVVAPTGVAAINAGGVTAHSFFQLPLGSFIPGSFRGAFHSQTAITDRHHLLSHLRISNEKRDLMQNLDLVVIDEVSMLRADMLDAIDTVLRHVRRNQREAFGGVQMLFIGDLYQLPPVVKEEEWKLLSEYYESPFFFGAQVFRQAEPICIELKKVYRQSDEKFIHLLNRVRNNRVDEDDFEKLHQRYQPSFRPKPEDRYITLTTHNYKADEINARELRRLPGKEFLCEAKVDGEFPDRNFPVEKTLRLKPGAQIMFVRNDTEEKKYFNGKIGIIKSIAEEEDEEFLEVEFPEEKNVIRVQRVTWQNIRYSFNEAQNKIEEDELGSFTQYPVRLAWAVTIHKSQGLTFEKVVIDAGAAFAPGQVYVALSRCVSIDGIVLLSRIPAHVIMTDETIVQFSQQQNSIEALLPLLEQEKQAFILKKTLALFDLQLLLDQMQDLLLYMGERKIGDKEKIIAALHGINDSIVILKETADKFCDQVKKMAAEGLSERAQAQLQDRMVKAKAYFEKALDENVNDELEKLNGEIQQQLKVRKLLKELKAYLDFFSNFTNRFRLHPKKREAKKMDAPVSSPDHAPLTDENAQHLFNLLRQIRRQFADDENVPPFMVCHDATLKEMATCLPQSFTDLAMIKGMGDHSLNKYGEAFLAVIQNFCRSNGLASQMHLKAGEVKPAKKKKAKSEASVDTQTQTLQLFESGKTIAEIAAGRNLAVSTIEGHLAYFVRKGTLDIFRVLSEEKVERIAQVIAETSEPGLTPVKNTLGDEASYGEIRLVMAHLNRE